MTSTKKPDAAWGRVTPKKPQATGKDNKDSPHRRRNDQKNRKKKKKL